MSTLSSATPPPKKEKICSQCSYVILFLVFGYYFLRSLLIIFFLLAGDEKEHLKVTNVFSALHGVMSCLPEMRPSYKDERSKEVEPIFFIAGSAGSTVGSSKMREKSAEFVHIACRWSLFLNNQVSFDNIKCLVSQLHFYQQGLTKGKNWWHSRNWCFGKLWHSLG